MVSGKTVTISRIVTKFSVTKSRIQCTYLKGHLKLLPNCVFGMSSNLRYTKSRLTNWNRIVVMIS